jgi:hypothetical protein
VLAGLVGSTQPCFGFVLKEANYRSNINLNRAKELGLHFYDYRTLKFGENVTLANGKVIQPKDVDIHICPGRKVAIVNSGYVVGENNTPLTPPPSSVASTSTSVTTSSTNSATNSNNNATLTSNVTSSSSTKRASLSSPSFQTIAYNCDVLIHCATFINEYAARAAAFGHATTNAAINAFQSIQPKRMILTRYGGHNRLELNEVIDGIKDRSGHIFPAKSGLICSIPLNGYSVDNRKMLLSNSKHQRHQSKDHRTTLRHEKSR